MAGSQSEDEQNFASKGRKKKARKDHEEIFCYCREPEGNRFMIGCDSCQEWYHGDCVQVTKNEGKEIDTYYCPSCRSTNADLKIIYFKAKRKSTAEEEPLTKRCNECINCITKDDCGECYRCKSKRGRCIEIFCMIAPQTNVQPKKKDTEKKHSRKTAHGELSDDDDDEAFSPGPARKAGGGGAVPVAVAKQPRGRRKGWRKDKSEKSPLKKGKDMYKQLRPGYDTKLTDRLTEAAEAYSFYSHQHGKKGRAPKPTQCLARGCILEANPGAKYCSDECGMSLAKERLAAYLPKGLEEYWKIEPIATKMAKEDAARRDFVIAMLNTEKDKLDDFHNMCLNYVDSIKQFKPDDSEEPMNDGDFMIACPVCAMEHGNRKILSHLQRCYAKQEKSTTYGTSQQCTINPHRIFCDEYNKPNNSFCKRLRVICPEHYKGEHEEGLQVCGWPKVWSQEGSTTLDNMFLSMDDIISKGMCGIARKDCKQHCSWIISILGLIDSRRLAVLGRLDEVIEGKKTAKTADPLLLMCNKTEYAQPVEKIIENFEAGEKAGGETVQGTIL